MAIGAIGLLLVLATAIGATMALARFGWVTRPRAERFALRQALPITVENGPLVLGYLATTRRWRAGGLLIAIAVSLSWSLVSGSKFSLGAAALFVGWFAGAIVAEWRVGLALDGTSGRRAALLVRRSLSTYLSTAVIVLALVSWVGVVAVEIAAACTASRFQAELAALVVGSVGVFVVITAVARHVLTRAQPLDEPGVLEADDALRSRSLHVLAGSGIAMAGYFMSLAIAVASRSSNAWGEGALSFSTAIGILVLPIVGLLVATAPSSPRRRHTSVSAVA